MAEYELWVDTEFKDRKSLKFYGSSMFTKLQAATPTLEELEEKAEAKEEIEVELRDPATMDNFKARVVLSQKPEELSGADKLWLVHTKGRLPQPWAVKIVERIEEEERDVTALPRRRLSIGERKGRMLSDLLKEREEKMKKKGG